MHSNLFLRIMSSIVFVPIVLVAIWYGRGMYEDYSIPLFNIFLACLGAGFAWEWDNMFNKKLTICSVLLTLIAILVVFTSEDRPPFALWLTLVGTTLIFYKTKGNLPFALGTAYICLPLAALSYLYHTNGHVSREVVLWLFFVVWATDVGGYVVGKSVGGPKLAPRISPKKTWAGFGGAICFAMVVAYVFALYLKAHGYMTGDFIFNTKMLVFSSGVLAIISQIGDLFESFIKRRLEIKDSSDLIPGQGGLFDRFDGLMFAAVAVALSVAWMGESWWTP
ncbi:MAG: CDP-archaeol synthase [Alphaproteobacteria bacterium]|nr:CDP-archaeol synthase [Alphaproteobacteria bacterium]